MLHLPDRARGARLLVGWLVLLVVVFIKHLSTSVTSLVCLLKEEVFSQGSMILR